MKNLIVLAVITLFAIVYVAFNKQNSGFMSANAQNASKSPIHKDKGIGQFKSINLTAIDPAKVKKGQSIFKSKCVVCHDLDKKIIGPPLRNITKDWEPEFILNMITNPVEMQKSDPEVKKLLKAYNNVPMADLKITKDDAYAVLDFLRSVAK